jgi:hypothetical protein
MAPGTGWVDFNVSKSFIMDFENALDANKDYKLTLKNGVKVTSPTTKVSLTGPADIIIVPKVISFGKVYNLYKNNEMNGNSVELHSGNNIYASGSSSKFAMLEVETAPGFTLENQDILTVKVYYNSNIVDTDPGFVTGNYAIQPYSRYNSSVNVDVDAVAKNDANKTVEQTKQFTNVYREYIPYIYAVYAPADTNQTQLRVSNVDYNAVIDSSNFKIFDENQTEVAGGIANVTYNSDSYYNVTLDYNTSLLTTGSSYSVEMIDVANSNGDVLPGLEDSFTLIP